MGGTNGTGVVAHRSRKRNCDEPGLQRSQKRGDVVEPLRCQYHRPISSRAVESELVGKVSCAPMQLRPRQALGLSVPVVLVIDKSERYVVRLQTRAFAQHTSNG